MKFAFKKGLLARDRITQFTGVITYRVDYITGCNQYGLTPTVDDKGEPRDSHQFDEVRIDILGRGLLTEKEFEDWKKNIKLPLIELPDPGGPQEPVQQNPIH